MNITKPSQAQINLITKLAGLAGLNLDTNWQANLLVSEMNDGGMGSLKLYPNGEIEKNNRKTGIAAAEYQFTDGDGIRVLATLYLDKEGQLFELDIWKADFSKVRRLPD